MTRSMVGMAVAVAVAWLASPSAADAQDRCEDASQCAAGAACVNGTCAQQQQQDAAPQPEEGQAQGGQAQGAQAQPAQQEQLPPPPQQQPPQQQQYPQQQYPQQQYPQQQYPQQQYPQQQYGAQPYPQQQQQYGNPLYGQPPQQQAPAEGRHLVGLIVGGVVLWAVTYAVNAFVSAFAGAFTICGSSPICPDESEWGEFRGFGFVPLIGPWMQLAAKPTPFNHDSWGGWLIGDAVLQTAGLTMLILGATIEVGGRSYGEGPGDGVELAIVPLIGPTQNGLQLVGTF